MTKKRRRPIHLHVMVSEAEQALIQERMAACRQLDEGEGQEDVTISKEVEAWLNK